MSSDKSKRKVEVGSKDRGQSDESSQRKVSVFERLGRSTQPEPPDRQQKCRNWERSGYCSYGSKCVFKHEDRDKSSHGYGSASARERRSRSADRSRNESPRGSKDQQPHRQQQQRRRSTSRGRSPVSPRDRGSPKPRRRSSSSSSSSPKRYAKDKPTEKSKPPPGEKKPPVVDSVASNRKPLPSSQQPASVQSTVVASKPSRFRPDTDDDDDDEQELLRKKRAIQNELKKLQEEAAHQSGGVASEGDPVVEVLSSAKQTHSSRPTQKTSQRGPCTPPPAAAQSLPRSASKERPRPSSEASKPDPKSHAEKPIGAGGVDGKRPLAVPSSSAPSSSSAAATAKPIAKKRPLPSSGKEDVSSGAKKPKLSSDNRGSSAPTSTATTAAAATSSSTTSKRPAAESAQPQRQQQREGEAHQSSAALVSQGVKGSGATSTSQKPEGPQKTQRPKPQVAKIARPSKDVKAVLSSVARRSPVQPSSNAKSDGGQSRTEKKAAGPSQSADPADGSSKKGGIRRSQSGSPKPARRSSVVVSAVSTTKKPDRQPPIPVSPQRSSKRSASPAASRPAVARRGSPPAATASSKDRPGEAQRSARPRTPPAKQGPVSERERSDRRSQSPGRPRKEPERGKVARPSETAGSKTTTVEKESKQPKRVGSSPSRSPRPSNRKADRSVSPEQGRSRRDDRPRSPNEGNRDQAVKPKARSSGATRQDDGSSSKASARADRRTPSPVLEKKTASGQAKSEPRARESRESVERTRTRRRDSSSRSPRGGSPAAVRASSLSRSGPVVAVARGSGDDSRMSRRGKEGSHSGSERGGRRPAASVKPGKQDSASKGSRESRAERERSPAANRSPDRSPGRSARRHRSSGSRSPRSDARSKRSPSAEQKSRLVRSPSREDDRILRQADHRGSSRERRRHSDHINKDKRYEDGLSRRDDESSRSRGGGRNSRSPHDGKRRSDVRSDARPSRGMKDDRRSSPPLLPPQLLFPLPPFYPLPPREGDRPLSPRSFGLLSHAPFLSDLFKHDRRDPFDERGLPSHSKEPSRYPSDREAPLPPPEPFGRARRRSSSPASPSDHRRRRKSSPSSFHRGEANRQPLPSSDYRAHSPLDGFRLFPPLPRELALLLPPLPPRSPPEGHRRDRERQQSAEPRPWYGGSGGPERKTSQQDRVRERSPMRYGSLPSSSHGRGHSDSGRLLPLPPPSYRDPATGRSSKLLPPAGGPVQVRRQQDGGDVTPGRRKFGLLPRGSSIGHDGDRPVPFPRGRGRMRIGMGTQVFLCPTQHNGKSLKCPVIGRERRLGMRQEGDLLPESARRMLSARPELRKRPRSPASIAIDAGLRRSSPMSRPPREMDGAGPLAEVRHELGDPRPDDKAPGISRQNRQRSLDRDRETASDNADDEPSYKRRRMDSERKPRALVRDGSAPASPSPHDRQDSARGDRMQSWRSERMARSRADHSPSRLSPGSGKGRAKIDRANISPSHGRKTLLSDPVRDVHAVGCSGQQSSAASPGRTGNEPLSGHLVSSIADEELDSLMSQQSEAYREEQESKQPSATCALDVDWTSLMATSVECTAAADSAAAGSAAAEQRGPERGVALAVSALSHFNSVAVLSRIGVSRAHAGDERYQAIVQCISEAAEQGVEGGSVKPGFLDDVAALHAQKRMERASCRSLLSDIGPGKKALWARKDLAIRRKLAGPAKASVVASRSSCGAVDRDLVKLSLQLFAADAVAKSTRSDVDVPT